MCLLLALVLLSAAGFADDITFRLRAPESVVQGQQFRLEYTVNGNGRDFRVGDFRGLDVLMGPSTSTSMSQQIINGSVSSSTTTTYTFVVVAPDEGSVVVPAATVKIDGRQYSSNNATVKVLPPDKASEASSGASGGGGSSSSSTQGIAKGDILLLMNLSKHKAYENEAILCTIKLLSINGRIQLQDFKAPSFDGFTTQEIELPENKQMQLEHYNGRNYYGVDLKQYLLFPQRSGKLTIQPATIELMVQVAAQRQMRSIFDDFFDQYQNVNKAVSSASPTVEVEALPFGKPSSFSGAVGDFTMTSSLSTNEIKANEALTLKIVISGNGNLKYAKDPEVSLPSDFEAFDPKVDLNIKAAPSGVSGSKTIEYTLIPRHAGDFEIAPIEFSYFDPKSGQYKTLATPAYPIKVAKGDGNSAAGGVSNFSSANQEAVKMLGSDIRYIRTGDLGLHRAEPFFFGSIAFWLIYLIPVILFAALVIIYRKQARENANASLVRTRKANKVAVKRLKTAARYLKEHQTNPFYDEIQKALWGYLSDKLSIPTSELSRDNAETVLNGRGVDADLTRRFLELISTCEFARYAPAQSDADMTKVYDEATDVIDKMEAVIRK
jgi:hypothetical protein